MHILPAADGSGEKERDAGVAPCGWERVVEERFLEAIKRRTFSTHLMLICVSGVTFGGTAEIYCFGGLVNMVEHGKTTFRVSVATD